MGAPKREVIAVIGKETQLAANQGFTIGASLTTGAANLIYTFGSDVQKNDFCQNMFSGKWAGTMCLTEPHAGSAVGDVITSATKHEDGHCQDHVRGTADCGHPNDDANSSQRQRRFAPAPAVAGPRVLLEAIQLVE